MRLKSSQGLGALALIAAIGLLAGLSAYWRQRTRSVAVAVPTAIGPHLEKFPPLARRADPQKPIVANAGTGTEEVCGFGRVPIAPDDPLAMWTFLGKATKQTAEQWLVALLDSDDIRSRAAGLMLEGKITGGETIRVMEEQTRDALVQLAVGSTDPAVYALAVAACGSALSTPTLGACEQISVRRWTQIEPGNVVPWLLLVGKARQAHDTAAEANAFSGAAQARTVDSYNYSLLAYSFPELPGDTTPLARWYFATEVTGIEAALLATQYSAASRHCSMDAVRDDSVRRECSAVAELLVSKGMTLLDLSVGKNIGARVGWLAERVRRLDQERDALMQALMQMIPQSDLWTCDGATRGNAYMAQRQRVGELAAARDTLERSGESVQVIAQKWTTYAADIQRRAMAEEQEKSAEAAP